MSGSDKTLVMVVEDDALIRLELIDVLSDLGFEVVDAANADDAVRLLEGMAPVDVVLTDIDMPGKINGLDLAYLIGDRWPPCKVVVISGRYRLGPDALPPGVRFLSKPVGEQAIGQVLDDLGVVPH